MDTFEYTILIGAGVIVVGIVVVAGLKALYQRGFEAGQTEGFNFSPEEFQKIYWLAQNGFTRLLLLGERGAGGFQTMQDAQEAHWALERLGHRVPNVVPVDDAFLREGKIMMRWPSSPLSPPQQLLKRQMLDKEP